MVFRVSARMRQRSIDSGNTEAKYEVHAGVPMPATGVGDCAQISGIKFMTAFTCATCGQFHAEMPLCFGPDAPALWASIPESERPARGELTSDLCVVDEKYFFVLGRILLPVIDGPGPFVWLAWVSLGEKNFLRTYERWESKGRESEPPYFAWLQSALPYDRSTLSLKASLQTMPVGERPEITLEPTDHPLSIEQQNGITMARVQQIVEANLHG